MVQKIKLGMVGGGQGAFIGAVHRIASRIDDRYELVAGAFSSNAERAQASGKELGISNDRNYQNFQDMAEKESQREDKIDAVAIVTPNHMHHPIAMEFMNKGIHIICDKPLAMNLKQCEELVQASQGSNIIFALTHNYTGYPMVRNAKAMCENGDIGNIRVIQAEYAQDWLTEILKINMIAVVTSKPLGELILLNQEAVVVLVILEPMLLISFVLSQGWSLMKSMLS